MSDPTRWPIHAGGETCDQQDYSEVTTMDGRSVVGFYRCQHNVTEPVIAGGEHVSAICLTCDATLPPRPSLSGPLSDEHEADGPQGHRDRQGRGEALDESEGKHE